MIIKSSFTYLDFMICFLHHVPHAMSFAKRGLGVSGEALLDIDQALHGVEDLVEVFVDGVHLCACSLSLALL